MIEAHIKLHRNDIDINSQKKGWTVLALASSAGSEKVVEILLRAHANPNVAEPDGFTPLLFGAHHGYARIVDALLFHGADIYHKSGSGQTALSLASNTAVQGVLNQHIAHMKSFPAGGELLEHVRLGHVAKVREMLEQRGRYIVGERNDRKWTCTHFAASAGNAEMLKLLLTHGADVNAPEQDGWTPLLFSINAQCPECVVQLLEAGSEIASKEAFDHMVAVAGTHGEIVALLAGAALRQHLERQRQLTGDFSLDSASILDYISAGASANIANTHGVTALMLFSQSGDLDAAREIINRGADVSWQEQDGWTAVMFAVHGENEQIVRLLVDEIEEADLFLENKHGDTALDIAKKLGRVSILRLLVEAAGGHEIAEHGGEGEMEGQGESEALPKKSGGSIFRFFGL